jgi:tryptophan halogenase
MDFGWCWQIEHETRINRGYVYSSDFISDDAAEAEFRRKNASVDKTRVVKYVSGRYERSWVKNVVAIGNASGFVEPLESTALGFICSESVFLIEGLMETDRQIRPISSQIYNNKVGRGWDVIRQFLSIHYKFNTRYDTPFWRACREKTDLCGAAGVVECFRQNGPSSFFSRVFLDQDDQFTMEGYLAMLVGQQVAHTEGFVPSAGERQAWEQIKQRNRALAASAFGVQEALSLVRSPNFRWPMDLYPKLCQPAPAVAQPRQSGATASAAMAGK